MSSCVTKPLTMKLSVLILTVVSVSTTAAWAGIGSPGDRIITVSQVVTGPGFQTSFTLSNLLFIDTCRVDVSYHQGAGTPPLPPYRPTVRIEATTSL